jgi:hypothetical protein
MSIKKFIFVNFVSPPDYIMDIYEHQMSIFGKVAKVYGIILIYLLMRVFKGEINVSQGIVPWAHLTLLTKFLS